MTPTDFDLKTSQIDSLLTEMRNVFLQGLNERFDKMEQLTISLEKDNDKEIFNELYRETHSLKGSGGTHGLPYISTICHQLETNLSLAESGIALSDVSIILAYIDLLRQVTEIYQQENKGFSIIELEIERLNALQCKEKMALLVAESSRTLQSMYKKALEKLPVQLTIVDNGMIAMQMLVEQKFDAVLISKELQLLNGLAVAAAVQNSSGKNSQIPVFMVTSSQQPIPEHLNIQAVLFKDKLLPEHLETLVKQLLS